MGWTKESRKRALDWLSANKDQLQCQCAVGSWTVDENLAAVPVVPQHEGDSIQVRMGPYFVFLVVTCEHCHQVHLFHATKLGVLDGS